MVDDVTEKPAERSEPDPDGAPAEAPASAPGDETKADAASIDAASTDAAAANAPKKRKKKRKKVEAEPEAKAAPREIPLDKDGRERPLFVLAFPSDPELDRLVRAFELGNYALVRTEAPKLAERAESEAVRDAARELARRIEPDPLIKILLLLSVLLLLALTVWAYKTHGQ